MSEHMYGPVCVACVCAPGIVQQKPQPLKLLRNAFEVDHNEALYLPCSPEGDLQAELNGIGSSENTHKKKPLTSYVPRPQFSPVCMCESCFAVYVYLLSSSFLHRSIGLAAHGHCCCRQNIKHQINTHSVAVISHGTLTSVKRQHRVQTVCRAGHAATGPQDPVCSTKPGVSFRLGFYLSHC